jgi:hypothetical protein
MIKLSLKDEMPKKKKGTEFTFAPELSGAGEPDIIKKRIDELKGAVKALSKQGDYFEKEIKNLQSYVDMFEGMLGKKKEDEGTEKKANQLNTMDFKKKHENPQAYYSKAFGDKGFASKLTKNYKPQGRAFPKIASIYNEIVSMERTAGIEQDKEWKKSLFKKKVDFLKQFANMLRNGDVIQAEGSSSQSIDMQKVKSVYNMLAKDIVNINKEKSEDKVGLVSFDTLLGEEDHKLIKGFFGLGS